MRFRLFLNPILFGPTGSAARAALCCQPWRRQEDRRPILSSYHRFHSGQVGQLR
jgi:hypothetical protein